MSSTTSNSTPMSNQSADSASDNSSETASSCASEQVAVDVELGSNEAAEQLAVLALAWILLLYRGTVDNHEGFFTWGFSNQADSREDSGRVSDVITSNENRLSKLLEVVRQRRRKSSQIDDAAGSFNVPVFFSNYDPSENSRPEWACSIEVVLQNTTAHVRPFGQLCWPSRSSERVATLVFRDIVESLCTGSKDVVSQFLEVMHSELDQLWDWNSPVPPTIDRCIHEYFLENAKTQPSKQAVVSWDGELSYEQVDRLSYRLAAYLVDQGITIGDAIPLCFEKSIWTIVAVMAVLRVGGALVMTDPSQPEERLRTIVTEVHAKHLLSSCQQAELTSRIGAGAKLKVVGPHLLQGTDDEDVSNIITTTLPNVPSSTTLYIQFTSGSTGKPKGVVISHSNYVSGAVQRIQAIGYTPRSRVLDFASYAFDVCFDCMFCTLAAGGTVCEPSELERLNDMNGAIKRMSVNMAHMTPSVARILTPDAFSSLEVLGLGGEAISASDMSQWGQHTKVIIAYGPSECTVGCTVSTDADGNRKTATIGKGAGASIWLVDPENHDRLAPIGSAGELLVEGPIVGNGYLNNPQLTSQAFIEDPKWLVSGTRNFPGRHGRLYKTGDLVKYDSDGSGSLIFVGRRDQQVKIRGQRVELEEIEYHLKSMLPQNASIAAEMIVPKGGNKDPVLVAFLAEQREDHDEANQEVNSFSPTVSEILQGMNGNLSNVLPRYMIPTTYIPLPKIPLLVSCKTDRKTLRHIGSQFTREDLAKFRVASPVKNRPMNSIEVTLSEAWQEVLGGDTKVGLQDDFFSVGGDSLKAMKLVSTLRAAGVSLTVGEIFSKPVLEDMATNAKKADDTNFEPTNIPPFSLVPADWTPEDARVQAAELCQVEASSIEDLYPCSPLQEGFMALSAKVSGAYVAQRVVELPNIETASKLQNAFDRITADQPVLRTRIIQVPGRGLMQAVIRGSVTWNLADDLQEYLSSDRENPMELNKPLSRLGLISTKGDSKAYLVWTIHHALYDGWSMPLVVKRINEAYQGVEIKSPTPYNVFIKTVCGTERQNSEDYWRKQLQGAVSRQFPVVPVPGYQARAQSLLEHYVPLSLRSVSSSTTIANAIRGAWALTAALYASSNDVVFGETLTGRNAPIPGIEEIEGPTITTVPVRMRINKKVTVSEYLRNILSQTAERIPHEHFGLQHIRRLNPDAREACDLRTGIVIHPPMEADEGENDRTSNPANGFIPADDIEAAREALNFNSFALMLVFSLDENGFLIMASFDSELVDVTHMQRILERFGETVQQLSKFPQMRLGELDIFAERDSSLDLGNNNDSSSSLGCLADCEYEDLANISNTVTSTWIVDPSNPEHLLPPGAVGELIVQGTSDNLTPLTTIPRWLSASISPNETTGLYHTGRIARYRGDGTLMFVKKSPEHDNDSSNAIPIDERAPQDPTEGTTTDKERKMARLWSRILGVSEDGIHAQSGFFDLGGDSIMAMRLVSEARLENLKLTVAQIFIHRLFGHIVAHAEEEEQYDQHQGKESQNKIDNNDGGSDVRFSLLGVTEPEEFVSTSIKPKLSDATWEVVDAYPVRPLQRVAVKGTIQIPKYSARYEAIYFEDSIDWDRLRRSCQELVDRNEILRTIFVENSNSSNSSAEEEYLGVVLKSLNVSIDIYETDNPNLREFVQKFCHLDAELRIPLGSAFVKFFLIKDQQNRNCLILRISHAQYDEICLPVLLQQLSALYEGKEQQQNEAADKLPQTVPFSSYVRHVVQDNIPQSEPYWRDLLKDSKMSITRPTTPTPITSKKHFAISREFNITGRPTDVTVATLPTAAWALCLANRLSTRDVVFGEVVSGRNVGIPQTAPVMGPCWQYVPIRIRFDPAWTGLDLLRYVQNQHIASAPYEGVGLSEMIEKNYAPPNWIEGTETETGRKSGREQQWFDSVVHQDVQHVENLPFLSNRAAELETIYPHEEPLREWKIQAFHGKKKDGSGNVQETLCLEVVTVESWKDTAGELLDGLGSALGQLVKGSGSLLFESEKTAKAVSPEEEEEGGSWGCAVM